MKRTDARGVLLCVLLAPVLAGMLFPLGYMLVSSLSVSGKPSLANYTAIFSTGSVGRPFINSTLVAAAVTMGNLLFCTMAGYAFARKRFFLKNTLFFSSILVMMIPAHIIIIPLFILTNKLGMFDTFGALILPFLVNPLGIFLMKQYIENLPPEMEDAARIDGAGEFAILFWIVMPLCRPALAVLAIQVFLTNWNSFLFPFILTNSKNMQTLPVALAMLVDYQGVDWPFRFAASAVLALPIIIFFLIFQRQIVSGITAGALKQ